MRYAILSDTHANLEALTAVLAAVEALDVDGYLCVGDIVGYGPDPAEVLARVRSLCAAVVLGNHDHAAVNAKEGKYFNPWGAEALAWTRERLPKNDLEFLAGLPLSYVIEGVRLVHASPRRSDRWEYVMSVRDAAREFGAFKESICFIGHTHIPMFVETTGGRVRGIAGEELRLKTGARYIINVGSVGQPRDGDPRACFALLDQDAGTVRFHRVEYDAERTREKIIEAGLPRLLGDRLMDGR